MKPSMSQILELHVILNLMSFQCLTSMWRPSICPHGSDGISVQPWSPTNLIGLFLLHTHPTSTSRLHLMVVLFQRVSDWAEDHLTFTSSRARTRSLPSEAVTQTVSIHTLHRPLTPEHRGQCSSSCSSCFHSDLSRTRSTPHGDALQEKLY